MALSEKQQQREDRDMNVQSRRLEITTSEIEDNKLSYTGRYEDHVIYAPLLMVMWRVGSRCHSELVRTPAR